MAKQTGIENLKDFLDEKADFYNNKSFIENDPIQIPHRLVKKADIEIAAFLTATISWGNRKSIIADAEKMLNIMDHSPHDFILNFTKNDLKKIGQKAVHRTFSAEDFIFFLSRLRNLYSDKESLESYFLTAAGEHNFYHALERFRSTFFAENYGHRSSKHLSSTYKNSAAKRLMMFLRWMVRDDKRGVDFGIWKEISPKHLSVPLDVHSGNIARKLNILTRRQNDWKAVEELDQNLRIFDAEDPAKYDFALFGLGVSREF